MLTWRRGPTMAMSKAIRQTHRKEPVVNMQRWNSMQFVRASLVTAVIAVLAITSVHGAAANQAGPPVGSRVGLQIALCKLGGGEESQDTSMTGPEVTVTCRG